MEWDEIANENRWQCAVTNPMKAKDSVAWQAWQASGAKTGVCSPNPPESALAIRLLRILAPVPLDLARQGLELGGP